MQLVQRNATWAEASAACRKLHDGSAFLASDITKTKHDFTLNFTAKAEYDFDLSLVPFHIGLRFDAQSGMYVWQEQNDYGVNYAVGRYASLYAHTCPEHGSTPTPRLIHSYFLSKLCVSVKSD